MNTMMLNNFKLEHVETDINENSNVSNELLISEVHLLNTLDKVKTQLKRFDQPSLRFTQKPLNLDCTISSGICVLTRRNSLDSAFMRKIWRNKEFLYHFHRNAGPLPTTDKKLEEILKFESSAPFNLSNSLHWIVKYKKNNPWGLLSLVDISNQHKKAEVMLGVLPGAPMGLSVAAMLLLFQFAFNNLKLNKLYVLNYLDNPHALSGVRHLGFELEGLLKKELFDPKSNCYVDIARLFITKNEAFSDSNKKLINKLLSIKIYG